MVRHHNSKDRISNKDISGSEDNDIYLLELFEQHINSFKSGSKQIILKLYTELFNLAIYKAQQHGNKRNFIGVKLIEQYMKQTKHYEEYNFVYKKSAVYNLLLRRLGLNKFEQLRSVISMFKT